MNKYLLVLAAAGAAVTLLSGGLEPSAVFPGQRIRLSDGAVWVVLGRDPDYPGCWLVHDRNTGGDSPGNGYVFSLDEESLRAAARGEYPPLPDQGAVTRNGLDSPAAYRRHRDTLDELFAD